MLKLHLLTFWIADLIRFVYTFIVVIISPKQTLKSIQLFKKIKAVKSSDTLVILSGFKGHSIPNIQKSYDVYGNSSGSSYFDSNAECNYVLHYNAPYHVPLNYETYESRVSNVVQAFNPKFVIATGFGEVPLTVCSAYRFFRFWAFLKPYNGPAFLIWLGMKVGYKEIVLVGCEGTQMCGATMAREGGNVTYQTSIFYLGIATSRMLREYDYIFKQCKKNNVKVVQVSDSSWIQPNEEDRRLVSVGDSWS